MQIVYDSNLKLILLENNSEIIFILEFKGHIIGK